MGGKGIDGRWFPSDLKEGDWRTPAPSLDRHRIHLRSWIFDCLLPDGFGRTFGPAQGCEEKTLQPQSIYIPPTTHPTSDRLHLLDGN